MSLQHLHLYVEDRLIAETFYSSWFGLRVQRHSDDTVVMADERDFLLALTEDPSPAPVTSRFHFAFRLNSVAEVLSLHARMTQADVSIIKPLRQDEAYVAYRCADLDGYLIDVYWEPARGGGA
ncbi:MAG: Glyoxalase/bleomycin resistance protein/dioxygenase [Rhodocyclales bacterium]|nr:Glyoxalase/bleomycin resistance protein/dioxygenase [Rhodocyclales bacterium]